MLARRRIRRRIRVRSGRTVVLARHVRRAALAFPTFLGEGRISFCCGVADLVGCGDGSARRARRFSCRRPRLLLARASGLLRRPDRAVSTHTTCPRHDDGSPGCGDDVNGPCCGRTAMQISTTAFFVWLHVIASAAVAAKPATTKICFKYAGVPFGGWR